MNIKHTIGKHDDKIGISKEVQSFCELVNELDTPVTIAINGKWGTGKSKFVELCVQYFERKKDNGEKEQPDILPIYINAWENDYSEDPLVILLANILNTARENHLIEDKLDEKIKKEAGRLFKAALPALLKLGTAGLLGIHELDSVIEKYSESVLDDYYKERESLDKLKTLLNDLIRSPRKIIVFVDELDRCTPLFAIKMLERVKHLFEIENVVFVFSVDKIQLSAAISKVYGSEYDSTGYLWRFFNLTYELPFRSGDYVEYLYEYYNFKDLWKLEALSRTDLTSRSLLDPIKTIVSSGNLGYRDCELFMSRLYIFLKTYPKTGYPFPILSSFLIYLYHFRIDLFNDYASPDTELTQILEYVRAIYKNSNNKSYCAHLEALLIQGKSTINPMAASIARHRNLEIVTDQTLNPRDTEYDSEVYRFRGHYESKDPDIKSKIMCSCIRQLGNWS